MHGLPYTLSMLQLSSGSWAGNRPFLFQPKVGLIDAGGNIVVHDSSTVVTAEVTPSISYSSFIVVDTSNDPVPDIARVSYWPKHHFSIDCILGIMSAGMATSE